MNVENETGLAKLRLPSLNKIGRGLQILLVDDDDDDTMLIEMVLEGDPRIERVERAIDGDDALKIIEAAKQPFDLILLDINMPRCDGFTFLSHLRELKEHRQTPVVVLTSSSSAADYHVSLVRHANAFATKPNSHGELKTFLKNLVKQLIWSEQLPTFIENRDMAR